MALFAVSFRVGTQDNSDERRKSLVERARFNALGNVWEETTSFLLFNYSKSADDLASDIYTKSLMSSTYDQLLVVDLSLKDYAKRGNIAYPNTLDSLMKSR